MRDRGLDLLFQYASGFDFDNFDKLFLELKPALPDDELREAYLMRAQIKLYATDATLVGDLEEAARIGVTVPRYPCLCDQWALDSPNRFIVFPKTEGALRAFLLTLPDIREEFGKWYGEQGSIAARQVQGEIHYFLGEIDKAFAFAEEQYGAKIKCPVYVALSLCLLYRCCLAGGLSQKAEDYMLELIRLSQSCPESLASYRALRAWANLTTGWNGETPRFYNAPGARWLPVLDARMENVRRGGARTTPLEKPFVNYAERSYKGAYALRQYYMDLFHAMYWFQVEDYGQAESYFSLLYHISSTSGLFMPFVECGKQIAPLLGYMKNMAPRAKDWIAMVLPLAGQYEESLDAYRT